MYNAVPKEIANTQMDFITCLKYMNASDIKAVAALIQICTHYPDSIRAGSADNRHNDVSEILRQLFELLRKQ